MVTAMIAISDISLRLKPEAGSVSASKYNTDGKEICSRACLMEIETTYF